VSNKINPERENYSTRYNVKSKGVEERAAWLV